jgi:hypothetical protein
MNRNTLASNFFDHTFDHTLNKIQFFFWCIERIEILDTGNVE